MSEIIKMRPKIHIDVCTHRITNPFFANSMLFMLDYMRKTGIEYETNWHAGVSNLVGGRQNRVHEAIKSDCTHMLFVDDDMVFSMNVVHKMLNEMNTLVSSGVQKVAMGVNYCRKGPEKLYYTAKAMNNEFMESKGEKGVAETSACGLGLLLVEISVLREIPDPHFEILWMPHLALYDNVLEMLALLKSADAASIEWRAKVETLVKLIENQTSDKQEHQGEDYYFVRKLREHGVRVFIDQDISQTIGHAGDFIYSFGCYQNAQKT